MPDSKKSKTPSALIQAVVGLDNYFSELARIGEKIDTMNINTEADYDLLQKLLVHFAENGEGLEQEVGHLSNNLNLMRGQADAIAVLVGQKAKLLQERNEKVQNKMREFKLLSEKVHNLAATLNDVKPSSDNVTEEERARIAVRLGEFEIQLHPLIEEANAIKNVAHDTKMKTLEQSADSLGQSLLAMSKRINVARESYPSIN